MYTLLLPAMPGHGPINRLCNPLNRLAPSAEHAATKVAQLGHFGVANAQLGRNHCCRRFVIAMAEAWEGDEDLHTRELHGNEGNFWFGPNENRRCRHSLGKLCHERETVDAARFQGLTTCAFNLLLLQSLGDLLNEVGLFLQRRSSDRLFAKEKGNRAWQNNVIGVPGRQNLYLGQRVLQKRGWMAD